MTDEVVKLWLMKAGNDLKTGKDELATAEPTTDTICFHMQQCVEKCLKAFLIYKGKEISRTHNLSVLLQECAELDADFERLKTENVDELTAYAVDMRYPSDFYMPTPAEAQAAVKMAEEVRSFVSAKIGH